MIQIIKTTQLGINFINARLNWAILFITLSCNLYRYKQLMINAYQDKKNIYFHFKYYKIVVTQHIKYNSLLFLL